MKFRKKPIVIEAEQWDGMAWERWADDPNFFRSDQGKLNIITLEGPLTVSVGDWIITGIWGERYPCKPDIFEATYEPVE